MVIFTPVALQFLKKMGVKEGVDQMAPNNQRGKIGKKLAKLAQYWLVRRTDTRCAFFRQDWVGYGEDDPGVEG